MPFRITCPGCDTANSASPEKSGKRIKCKKCGKSISIPDHQEGIQESRNAKAKASASGGKKRNDDDDDRPARKNVKKPKKGAPVLLILGGVAVAALLLCVIGVGGGGTYIFFRAKSGVQDLNKELADAQAKQKAEFDKLNKPVEVEKKNEPVGKKNEPPKVDPTPQPKTDPPAQIDPKPPLDPQLQQNSANLTVNLSTDKSRSVKLNTTWLETSDVGGKKTTKTEMIDADVLESLILNAQGATLRTAYGNARWVVDADGQVEPRDPQAVEGFRKVPPIFLIDRAHAIMDRTGADVLGGAVSFKNQIKQAHWQLYTAMEVTSVPMPNRTTNPQESWPAIIPMSVRRKAATPEKVDLILTCVYEGTRFADKRTEAIITVTGKVVSKNVGGKTTGDVAGKIHFDLVAGMISTAKLKINYQYPWTSPVNNVLDFQIARAAGNLYNIQPDNDPTDPFAKFNPIPKIDPNPKSDPIPKMDPNAKVVMQQTTTLGFSDQFDPYQNNTKTTHRMKPFLTGIFKVGKTYYLTVTSTVFDPTVRVQSGNAILAEQSGTNKSVTLAYRPTRVGGAIIAVTNRDGKHGPFQLTVTEQ